jgi:hypothetical protein
MPWTGPDVVTGVVLDEPRRLPPLPPLQAAGSLPAVAGTAPMWPAAGEPEVGSVPLLAAARRAALKVLNPRELHLTACGRQMTLASVGGHLLTWILLVAYRTKAATGGGIRREPAVGVRGRFVLYDTPGSFWSSRVTPFQPSRG